MRRREIGPRPFLRLLRREVNAVGGHENGD
jgi:hypothetical protein